MSKEENNKKLLTDLCFKISSKGVKYWLLAIEIHKKNKCLERGVNLMTRRYRVANRFRFTVFVTIMIIGHWMLTQMTDFMTRLWSNFSVYVK